MTRTSPTPAADDMIVTKLSPWSVADSVARLSTIAADRGLKLFAVIDHSGEADLPLKVLVWLDGNQTKLSYTAPRELAARYDLSDDLAARLMGIDGITDAVDR
jgi:uncharacterized protein (DUF302 family)